MRGRLLAGEKVCDSTDQIREVESLLPVKLVAEPRQRLSQGAVEIAQVVEKTYVKNVEVRGLPRDRQNSEPNSQDFGNTKPYGTVLSYLTFGVYGILPPVLSGVFC